MGVVASLLALLVMCVTCGFVSTNPIKTRGIEEVRIDAPRHLSEVFAGKDEITIPVIWSGSSESESYAAVVIPGADPTVIVSRKVNTRDALKFFHAGVYQKLRSEGRVGLEVNLFTYKPAQLNLAPPDPVAMAIQVALRQEADGKYFTWLDGEVEVASKIRITVVAQPPKIRQIWIAEGVQPTIYVEVESLSQQAALQWASIKKGDSLLQGSSPFVPTTSCGVLFCAAFQVPLPNLLVPGERVATGYRVIDGSGFYSDYLLGWEAVGSEKHVSLRQLSGTETNSLVLAIDWNWAPYPRQNPPLVNRGVGPVPENPGVYQWLEELITRIRGGIE